MDELTVERCVLINAPQERVWQAITDPVQLEQWYAPGCRWEIPALQVGATIKFHNTATDVQLATIEVLEPPKELALRWQLDPAHPGITLLNSFLVEANDGNTRVTASQAGYASLPDDLREEQFRQDAEAYTAIAESLKNYLES